VKRVKKAWETIKGVLFESAPPCNITPLPVAMPPSRNGRYYDEADIPAMLAAYKRIERRVFNLEHDRRP